MPKVAKITVSILALLMLLFITMIILVTTFVDPNKFKNQITAAVQKNTGREIVIGDIQWSFFPWIGLRLQQVAVGNAPGFGQQAFAKVGEADVNIRLLPLFYGRVAMGTVTFKNLTLHLTQNARGQNNWSDMNSSTTKTDANNSSTSSSNTNNTNFAKLNPRMPNLTISNLDLSNANVTYDNQQTGQKIAINDLDFKSKGVNFNKSFPVDLKFNLVSNKPAIQTQVFLKSAVGIDTDDQRYAFHAMNLTGNLISKQYPKGRVPFALSGDISADLKKQTLIAKNMAAMLDILKMNGDLNGNKITQAPEFSSNITVAAFNLRTFLTDLGQKIQTEDPTALQSATLKAQAQFSPKYIKLSNLDAKLDDTTLTGKFNFANFTKKTFDFDLNLNQINLSRYLSNATANANDKGKNSMNAVAATPNVTPTPNAGGTLPVNLLRQLTGQGSFQIGKLTVANITTTNIHTQVNANNGIIKISPVSANLYQGKSQGAIVINTQGNVPAIMANESLTNVQVGDLMSDVSKQSKLQITGVGNLNMNVRTQGQNNDALIKALNGNINFSVHNGVIKNIDIGQQIYATIEHFFKRSASGLMNSNQTSFSSLTGTVQIVNGIANNHDLLLQSPSLKVTGKGSANLIDQTINFGMNAIALGSPFGQDIINLQQQVGGSIPIIISGNLSNPSIRPDYTTMAGSLLKGQFRQQIGNRFKNNPDIQKALNNLKGINLKGLLGS